MAGNQSGATLQSFESHPVEKKTHVFVRQVLKKSSPKTTRPLNLQDGNIRIALIANGLL